MSNISKYLPERSEYADKVANILKPYEKGLYVVGSNARKTLYGLKTNVKDYDFVIDCGCSGNEVQQILGVELEKSFPNKVIYAGDIVTADCETFTLKIRTGRLTEFLFSVRFAGDGLAVRVSDGRPIVVPEYMTQPSTVQIIEDKDVGDQTGEWLTQHVKVLETFQNDMFNLVQKQLDEPAKS